MRLIGIGIDVASVRRIDALVGRYGDRFARRWFDPAELTGAGQLATSATRSFAVKEAVWKALPHSAVSYVPWHDILAFPTSTDHVDVRLRGVLEVEAIALGVGAITASATTRGDLVVAVALVEAADGLVRGGQRFPSLGAAHS